LLAKAMAAINGEKFKRLWGGDTNGHAGDDSAADLAVCSLLAFWCGPDADRTDRLFRQSGLIRPKWDSRRGATTYGRGTIAKAPEGRTDFFGDGPPGVGANGRHTGNGDAGPGDGRGDARVGDQEPDQPPPSSAKGDFPAPIPASKLVAVDQSALWLVPGYIALGAITLLPVLWKVGKTTWLSHLLRALQSGGEFCGRRVRQGKVLYVTEETQGKWVERRDELGLTDAIEFVVRPFLGKRPDRKRWAEFLVYLREIPAARPADLVVRDTLSNPSPVKDENDAAEVREALMPLHLITEGRALLPVHHLRKSTPGRTPTTCAGLSATGRRGSGSRRG
jgi:hypothetical protein